MQNAHTRFSENRLVCSKVAIRTHKITDRSDLVTHLFSLKKEISLKSLLDVSYLKPHYSKS